MTYKPPGAAITAQPIEKGPRTGLIKSWSFSALSEFESCPYRSFLAKVKKLPQPSSPALDRGNAVHKQAEDFIQGINAEVTKDLQKVKDELEFLREEYTNGRVEVEGEWAFDENWAITEWSGKNTWNRMKLDVFLEESPSSCRIIDWKTGKKFGNEFKHSQQGQLYAIGVFLRKPELEFAKVEFSYTDHGQKLEKSYTRQQAMMFLPQWTERAKKMTTCEDFLAKPSKPNCKWCPFRDNGCEWGIA